MGIGIFKRSAAKADKTVGNYVWLPANADAARLPPVNHIGMVYKNARKYPAVKFIVWVDLAATDTPPQSALPNVIIRNINNDVPAYQMNALFKNPSDDNKWARVDMARLL